MLTPITVLSENWYLTNSAAITVSGQDITALYADMMLFHNRSERLSWLSIQGEFTVSSPYVVPAVKPLADEETPLFTRAERLTRLRAQPLPLALPESPYGLIITYPERVVHLDCTDLTENAACHWITHDVQQALSTLEHAQQQHPDIDEWVWFSLDSLIDRSILVNMGTELMHDDNPEGTLPGEAAVLLHLTKKPLTNSIQLSVLQRTEEPNSQQSVQQPVNALTQLVCAKQYPEKPISRIVCNANIGRLHASELHKTEQALSNPPANGASNSLSPKFQSFYVTTGDIGLASFPLAIALAAQSLTDPWHNQAQSHIGCAYLHQNQRWFVSLSLAPPLPSSGQ